MPLTPSMEDFDPAIFAGDIRAFIEDNNLTVRDWQGLTKLSFSFLTQLERGKVDPRMSTVARLQKLMRDYRRTASKRKS